jgi:hypothetical protein
MNMEKQGERERELERRENNNKQVTCTELRNMAAVWFR